MKPLVLSIKFITNAENKEAFKQILIELFNEISKEPGFVNAVLHEGIQKPEEILVYETWNETADHFLKVQMLKPYVIRFEQVLEELKVIREPGVYTSFAQWGTNLAAIH